MQHYTYKVTFKDLPGYFYYGSHKDNGKPYFGSPVTWACFWALFEPEIQILQWYETAKEVEAAEDSIIEATWKDRYSLNEHYGGRFSEGSCRTGAINQPIEIRSSNGKKSGPIVGPVTVKAMNDHANTIAVRSENGAKNGAENGKRSSKRVLLTNTATGDTLEFPSAHEASRALGLNRGIVCSVARGERKQHKGYAVIYT